MVAPKSQEAGRWANALQDFVGVTDKQHFPAVLAVHANIAAYALAFWLMHPLLPYISTSLGADRTTYGYLQSVLEAAHIVSSVMFGQIIDRFGAPRALLVAQAGTACSYVLLGLAYNLPLLFLSRLPTVFMSSMLCAQGALPKHVQPSNLSKAMGRLSLSYLLGMVTGSLLSGLLSQAFGHTAVAFLSAAVSLGTAAATYNTLNTEPSSPESTARTNSGSLSSSSSSSSSPRGEEKPKFNMAAALHMCLRPKMAPAVAVIALTGLAVALYRSQFSILLPDRFGLSEAQAGFATAYAALLAAICNVAVIAYISREYQATTIIPFAVAALSVSLFTVGLVDSLWQLLAAMLPISFATTTLYTVASAALTHAAGRAEAGTAVSISHSLRSFMGLVSPIIGGYVLREWGGYQSLFWLCSALSGAALIFALRLHPDLNVPKAQEDSKKEE